MDAQGLLADPGVRATARSVYDAVERMGFVQLDTITVVERAHHHILASRFDGYAPTLLERLHQEQRLFEHMTHDASLIPTKWFPQWGRRFSRPRSSDWWRTRIGANADEVVARILSRIRAEGPLMSKDFERATGEKQGPWWDWRPEKAALELLWRTGVIAVARRVSFQKVYDLTERVLPVASALPRPDEAEHVAWACRSALERLGTATPGELAAFWHLVKPAEARAWCASALRSGEAVPVLVHAVDGTARRALALPGWEAHARGLTDAPARMRLLSPFDPVLRDRKRALRLFGFDYRFEAFVPAPKRKFGYYVLPILEGERLVGRLDPKLHREKSELAIRRVFWEPGVKATKPRKAALEAAVATFARFLGAERFRLPRRR
jgi:uncharacterized protein YcaQ